MGTLLRAANFPLSLFSAYKVSYSDICDKALLKHVATFSRISK